MGIHALVKELRETDIDGVPLLFHAAASRRKHCCFRIAYDLVLTVLGKGGVMEQFEALDGLGRGILMHAARSSHVDTFKDVFDECKKTADQSNAVANDGRMEIPEVPYGFRRERQSDGTTRTPEKSAKSRRLLRVREVLGKVDRKGMTCLHHAAEAGSSAVLSEVVKECGLLWDDLGNPDRSGRTPIMLVLRNAFCCEGEEHTCGETDLEDKFGILFDLGIGWMQLSRIQPQRLPAPRQTPVKTWAVTELIHAARGGVASLELALNQPLPESKTELARNQPLPESKTDSEHGFGVHLDRALATAWFIDGSRRQLQDEHDDTAIWRRALLLAAAARLGDVDVLYHVLDAIEVSQGP